MITNAPTLLVVQHIDREGPDLVAAIAREQGMSIHTIRPDQGEPLPNPTSTQNTIALLLGGPMSLGERHQDALAWMQRELDWLTVWHQHNKPVLGICLGAQFLAVAAGGDVQPLQVGLPSQPLKEVGYGAIHWLMKPSSEPLLMGLQPIELVLHCMVIASSFLQQQPCWAHRFIAKNRCSELPDTRLACNVTLN
ncbi:MAG: gamma-glutamyl-gamma-aminobutyrate hydrolase family protein [Synechococcus sp. ArSW.bin.68]